MKKLFLSIGFILSVQFILSQNIIKYRYWFDYDFANKTSANITGGTTLNIVTNINTSHLSYGAHIITGQFQDNNGKWSVPFSSSFVREKYLSPNLVAYRYWFDGNLSNQTEVPINPSQTVLNGNLSLDASFLDSGTHYLYTQYKNEQGLWSVPTLDTFFKNTKAVKRNTYAYIKLSKSLLKKGDTLWIEGYNFPKNYKDSIKISNNNYGTLSRKSYTTNSLGKFNIFKIIDTLENGYNFV